MASAMLDIQSLPSLERFDSQLLELFRQGANDAGGAALHLMDEVQAPDDELALHRLLSIKANQQKAAAAAAVAAQQQQQQQQQHGVHVPAPSDAVATTSSSEGHGAVTPFAQPQSPRNPQQHAEHTTPTAAAAAGVAAAEYAAAGHGYAPHAAPGLPYGISPQLMCLAASNPFAAALAGSHTPPHHQTQPESPFATASGVTDIEAYARTLAGMAGMGGMTDVAGVGGSASDSGVGFKRRSRGAALPDLIKLEQDYMEWESAGPAAKRGKGQRGHDAYALSGGDSDEEDRSAGLSITADMDEATRARIRREKNRVAARKCRAKKMQFMVELQKTLRELMRKNEEYRLQVITWHKMFSREVRLREAMKRIIAVMWQSGVPPAASGYTANDVIIGLESGTLDVNGLLHTLAVLSAHRHLHAQDSTAAAAGVGMGKGAMGTGLTLATASPFAVDSPSAAAAAAAGVVGVGAGGSFSVPDTPQGQPGSPAAAQLQLQQSDDNTQIAGTDAGMPPGATAGGAVGGTAAELAGIPGSAAGGTVSSSAPLSGEFETTVLPQSLLAAAQNSDLASTPVAAADNTTPPPAAAAGAAPAPAAAAAVETHTVAVAARRNTSAHLEEVLAAAGFGDLQKFDSLIVPGLPDLRTQSSGLRALPSGTWAWGG